jgi:hypothetical protein
MSKKELGNLLMDKARATWSLMMGIKADELNQKTFRHFIAIAQQRLVGEVDQDSWSLSWSVATW